MSLSLINLKYDHKLVKIRLFYKLVIINLKYDHNFLEDVKREKYDHKIQPQVLLRP